MNLYGIKTCPSVKKAMAFLNENGIEYKFNDINNNQISKEKIEYWLGFTDAKSLFNPRSKAYRDLKLKGSNLNDKVHHLWENNALIKRPVIEHGLNGEHKLHVGFNEDDYKQVFL